MVLPLEQRLARAHDFYSHTMPTIVVNIHVVAQSKMSLEMLDLLDERCAHAVFEALARHGIGTEVEVSS